MKVIQKLVVRSTFDIDLRFCYTICPTGNQFINNDERKPEQLDEQDANYK